MTNDLTTQLDEQPKLINSHVVKCKGRVNGNYHLTEAVEALVLTYEDGNVSVKCPLKSREDCTCEISPPDFMENCLYEE